MKFRLLTMALAVALLGLFVAAPLEAGAAAPGTGTGITVPVVNAPVSGLANTVLNGTLNITQFANQGGQLVALGTLNNATLTNTVTGAVTALASSIPVAIPVTGASGSCTILTLDLGPLHLDLLGLVVDLSAVHLTITANSGSGQLLGNLLCAVANLLNGSGPLGNLAGLLNNILRQL